MPRILVALFVFVAMGCARRHEPVFRVALAVDRVGVRPGDTAHVTLTYTNVSSRSAALDVGNCAVRYEVADSTRAFALLMSRTCTTELRLREMRPGETISFVQAWRATRGGMWGSGEALPIGTYYLRPLVWKNAQAAGEPFAVAVGTGAAGR